MNPYEAEAKTINLYLDDARDCPEGFVLVRPFSECVDKISRNPINILSLDHDLAEEATGYDVCKWIVDQWQIYGLNYWPKTIYLHTANPVGRSNMFQLLKHYAPNYVRVYRSPMAIG